MGHICQRIEVEGSVKVCCGKMSSRIYDSKV